MKNLSFLVIFNRCHGDWRLYQNIKETTHLEPLLLKSYWSRNVPILQRYNPMSSMTSTKYSLVTNPWWWCVESSLSSCCFKLFEATLSKVKLRLNESCELGRTNLRNCKCFKNVTPLHFKPEEAAHGHYWTGDKKSYWLANKWQALHKQNKISFSSGGVLIFGSTQPP